jgi:hypothetical protein
VSCSGTWCELYWYVVWAVLVRGVSCTGTWCELFWYVVWAVLVRGVSCTGTWCELYWYVVWAVLHDEQNESMTDRWYFVCLFYFSNYSTDFDKIKYWYSQWTVYISVCIVAHIYIYIYIRYSSPYIYIGEFYTIHTYIHTHKSIHIDTQK